MALKSGTYNIKCKGTNTYIGRFWIEDKSFNPKPVFSLPNPPHEVPAIVIEKQNGNVYTIKEKNAPFTDLGGHLFALLLNQKAADKWCIEAQEVGGFTITRARDTSVGWVVNDPGNIRSQVHVSPLIFSPSEPPQYPPNELFEFIRVGYDEE